MLLSLSLLALAQGTDGSEHTWPPRRQRRDCQPCSIRFPVLFCHHPLLITNTPPASRSHGSQDTQWQPAAGNHGDFAQTWDPALRPQGLRAVSRQWTVVVSGLEEPQQPTHPPTLSDCRPPMEDRSIWTRAEKRPLSYSLVMKQKAQGTGGEGAFPFPTHAYVC